MAILSATFTLSHAALLFSGTSPGVQAQGLGMLLTGTVVMSVLGARLGSVPFAVFFPDGSLIALLAAVTAAMVAELGGASGVTVGATLAATLMLATVVTGVALWLIGRLHGGGVVRYVPYQVMAGVLAASGWSLAMGGATVAAGQPIDLALIGDTALLAKLAASAGLGLLMIAAAERFPGPATRPIVTCGAILAYHAAMQAAGWSLATQRGAGLLLTLPTRLDLPLAWPTGTWAAVDWATIGRHASGLLALIPVTAIVLLLGLSGIEAATGRDAAVDRDLRGNGITAIACGAAGGVLGVTSINRSLLVYNMGVRGPRAGLLAGLGGGLVPLLWPALLGDVPRFVLGGLLMFSGFVMLRQWLLRSRRRLSWPEWLTVVAVLAVTIRFGLVVGTFAGLLLGCLSFAVLYAQASPIRARYRGDVARSLVDRNEAERACLAGHAAEVLVLHLQGFVFFGTASRLLDELRREIASSPGTLRHLVIEFGNVEGVDASALASFERLLGVAWTERIALAFVAMPPGVAARLAALGPGPGGRPHVAPTLDAALEWREAAVLAGLEAGAPDTLAALLAADFDAPDAARAFVAGLERVEFAAGEVLMRQGEVSDDLVFIEAGRASVSMRIDDAEMRVRSSGVGTMIGEIGFCLGLPRTATVTADTPCRVLRLTRAHMDRLEAARPELALTFQRAVIRRLGGRLLDKDALIAALVRSGRA